MVRSRQRDYLVPIVFILLSLSAAGYAKYGGGTGTEQEPYLIYTAQQLNEIGPNTSDYDKHFKLMADIDLSDYDGRDGRPAFNIIARDEDPNHWFEGTLFSGTFDGNGHIISNLTIHAQGWDYVGLFGCTGGSKIINLGLENVRITGRSHVGGLVGLDIYGSFWGCYTTGIVTGIEEVGGLIGTYGTNVENCYSFAEVYGESKVGGLIGFAGWSCVRNCYAAGIVLGNTDTGGLIGFNDWGSTFLYSFWDMDTTGQTHSGGGKARTSEQMKQAAMYMNWNSPEQRVWTLDEGNDYPRLGWEQKDGAAIACHALSEFLEGSGTLQNPYRISTAEQFNKIGLFAGEWDKHFVLTSNIDMSVVNPDAYNKIGAGPVKTFDGVFEGNGHTISNFTFHDDSKEYSGLFGFIGETGIVRNLILDDMHVEGIYAVGGLAGINWGFITGCGANGFVAGEMAIGGLIGGSQYYDDTAADFKYGTMSCSYSKGVVVGTSTVGGFCGAGGFIDRCFSRCDVAGIDSVGGLCGIDSLIENSYFIGTVTGQEGVGVLMGSSPYDCPCIYNSYGVLICDFCPCYRCVNIVGDHFYKCDQIKGAFATCVERGHEDDFFDLKNAEGLLEAGWDFNTTWVLCEAGKDYPRLAWENTPCLGGGDGSQESPYQIYTAEQFEQMTQNPALYSKHLKLMNDIDFAGYDGLDGRPEFQPVKTEAFWYENFGRCYPFTGVFDGNGHRLKNIQLIRPEEEIVGVFAYVESPGQIKNLGLEGIDVSGQNIVGALVGFSDGMISGCYSNGIVRGNSFVGGLVGFCEGNVFDSYTLGLVHGDIDFIGGLVGFIQNGDAFAKLQRCYAATDVLGPLDWTGGVGGCNADNVIDCFYDIQVCPTSSALGCCNQALSNMGKTTPEMKTRQTFLDAGWDFAGEMANGTDDIWTLCEGTNYPRLSWQVPASDWVCPDGVGLEDLDFLTQRWLAEDCTELNGCEGADLDHSGRVNLADYAIFASTWLK